MKKYFIIIVLGMLSVIRVANASSDTSYIWIVPSQPGGGPDTIARYVANLYEKKYKTSVSILNIEGANGELALKKFIYNNEKPGKVWFFSQDSIFVINPILYKRSFEATQDLVKPVAQVAINQFFLLANIDDDVENFSDFLKLNKSEKYTYASGGIGSLNHILMEELANHLEMKLIHIPYKGNSSATIGLTRGDVRFLMAGVSSLPLVKSRKLKILAVTSPNRLKHQPDIPSVSEYVKGFDGQPWFGLFAKHDISVKDFNQMQFRIKNLLLNEMNHQDFESSFNAKFSFLSGAELSKKINTDYLRYKKTINIFKHELVE